MIVLESMCTHMNSKTVPSPHVQTHETQLMAGREVVLSGFKADGSRMSNKHNEIHPGVCMCNCDMRNFNQQLNLFGS